MYGAKRPRFQLVISSLSAIALQRPRYEHCWLQQKVAASCYQCWYVVVWTGLYPVYSPESYLSCYRSTICVDKTARTMEVSSFISKKARSKPGNHLFDRRLVSQSPRAYSWFQISQPWRYYPSETFLDVDQRQPCPLDPTLSIDG